MHLSSVILRPCARFVVLFGVSLVAGFHASPGAEIARGETVNNGIPELVERVQKSVVLITVEGRDGGQASLGSGFVVDSSGLIATNLHVLGEARPITVTFQNGRRFLVTEVHASDRSLDLAVIRIDANDLPELSLAASTQEVDQGEPVVAFGNPMGLRNSVVQGLVSGMREIGDRRMIQIAMPVESGNSGGPLVDQTGTVLGVITLKSAVTANLGFAVRADSVRKLLEKPNPIAMTRWQTIGSLNSDHWRSIFGARWVRRAGVICVNDAGQGFGGRALCLSQQALPDGKFEVGVFVKLSDESGAAGLVFDSDGYNRHYGFYPSGGRLRLTRFNGPSVYNWQILDEFSSPHYRPGDWNHLKVRVDDLSLTCFVNDKQVLTRQLTERPSGKTGLAKFRDTRASFRRFRMSSKLAASRPTEAELRPIRREIEQLSQDAWGDEVADAFTANPTVSRLALNEQAAELKNRAAQLTRLANDIHVVHVCNQLTQLMSQPKEKISLAHAALLVSQLDNPELEIGSCLDQLAQMAAEIEAELTPEANEAQRIKKLNNFLFAQNGFHGSRTHYYHAANSYFDRVLDDREGLPITLSILYIDLANRLGLNIEGVGLPGHFIVRHVPTDGQPQLLDVFDGAQRWSRDDAARRVLEMTGRPLTDAMLVASPPRSIIVRVLRNLQGIAQRDRNNEALLRYLEAMVRLQPDDPGLRGMRAVVRHETGRKQAALRDLDQILDDAPPGLELETIRQLRLRFAQ